MSKLDKPKERATAGSYAESQRSPTSTSEEGPSLMEQLEPHLGWLPPERRYELERPVASGDLSRALAMVRSEQSRYPKNLSIGRSLKVLERASIANLLKRLAPHDRLLRFVGKGSVSRADHRDLLALVNGQASIEDLIRDSPLNRLTTLTAIDDLLRTGVLRASAPVEETPRAPTPRPATLLGTGPVTQRSSVRISREDDVPAARVEVRSKARAEASGIRDVDPSEEEELPAVLRGMFGSPSPPKALPKAQPVAPPPDEESIAPRAEAELELPELELGPGRSLKEFVEQPEEPAEPSEEPVDAPGEAAPLESPESPEEPPPSSEPPPESAEPVRSAPRRPAKKSLLSRAAVPLSLAAILASVAYVMYLRSRDAAPPSEPAPAVVSALPEAPATPVPAASSRPLPYDVAPTPAQVSVTIEVSPAKAVVTLDGAKLTKPYVLSLPRGASKHVVVVKSPGFKPRELEFDATSDSRFVIDLLPVDRKSPAPRGAPAPPTAPEPSPL